MDEDTEMPIEPDEDSDKAKNSLNKPIITNPWLVLNN